MNLFIDAPGRAFPGADAGAVPSPGRWSFWPRGGGDRLDVSGRGGVSGNSTGRDSSELRAASGVDCSPEPAPGGGLWDRPEPAYRDGRAGEPRVPCGDRGRRDIDAKRSSRRRGSRRADAAAAADYSVTDEAYRAELDFDRKRARRRRRGHVLRLLAAIVLVPVTITLVFFASYALTCILNGASPEELAGMMGDLLRRIEGLFHDLASTTAFP